MTFKNITVLGFGIVRFCFLTGKDGRRGWDPCGFAALKDEDWSGKYLEIMSQIGETC
jgi:hypothetical protein